MFQALGKFLYIFTHVDHDLVPALVIGYLDNLLIYSVINDGALRIWNHFKILFRSHWHDSLNEETRAMSSMGSWDEQDLCRLNSCTELLSWHRLEVRQWVCSGIPMRWKETTSGALSSWGRNKSVRSLAVVPDAGGCFDSRQKRGRNSSCSWNHHLVTLNDNPL